MFHRNHVLEPAIYIAIAYVCGGGLCDGTPFSKAAQDAVLTLQARPGDRTTDSLIFPDHALHLDIIERRRWEEEEVYYTDTVPQLELSGTAPSSCKKRSNLLLGEDKTHSVMLRVRPDIDKIVHNGSYTYPTAAGVSAASVGTRALTQAWAQMAASRMVDDPAAWINKLYASSSAQQPLHCYLKLVDEGTMAISRWYDDSTSLENTVAVILYSLEQLHTHPNDRVLPPSRHDWIDAAPAPSQSASLRVSPSLSRVPEIFNYLWGGLIHAIQTIWWGSSFQYTAFSLKADPTWSRVLLSGRNGCRVLFDEFVGRGASGTALRCRREKKIVKFGHPAGILHEALIYEELVKCERLAIPGYWGLYPLHSKSSYSERLAIILDDVGAPIEISHMTKEHKTKLAHLIRQLHEVGVHHHDVFGNTVVDSNGAVHLVDFDHAELVPPGTSCPGCDDMDSLTVLDIED